MRNEKEIRKLLDEWIVLKQMLDCEDDYVSTVVSEHAVYFINTLKWVLGEDPIKT